MNTNYNITQDDTGQIIYLDINICNDSKFKIPANISINRVSPILPGPPSDYFISVERFSVNCAGNNNLMIMFHDTGIISIKYNGIVKSSVLTFQQNDFNNNGINSNNDVQGSISSYQQLVNIINNSLIDCFNQHSLSGLIPYMVYDHVTNLFTVYAPLSWADIYPYTDSSKPKIFFDKLFGPLMPSFNNITYNFNQDNNKCDYLVIISNNNNNLYTDENNNKWLFNRQEYVSLQYLNSLTNITIVSNLIPADSNNLNNVSFQNSSSSATLNILTDFQANYNEPGVGKSVLQYNSSGKNRYISLYGNTPMYNIDLNLYLFYINLVNNSTTKNNCYQNLLLYPYDSVCMKLIFKKKNLNY